MKSQLKVGVIGGGAWGTALAVAANRAGSKVMLATRNKNVVESIMESRSNDIYLPGVFIDPAITPTHDLAETCRCDFLIMAVPSHCVRSACIAISDFLAPSVPVVAGSKGLERGSLLLMSEVIESVMPENPLAVLSGPGFAREVASGQPSATTIACEDEATGEMLTYGIGGKLFRPYLTKDLIGTQIGGTVKNVIAIACGIAQGHGLGENARAALITRGFAEMARLGLARGGKLETMAGLSGLGDLVLTCASATSRNMSLGLALGSGKDASDVISGEGRGVLEGATSAESVVKLAERLTVEMPIATMVHHVLSGKITVPDAVKALTQRPFAAEWSPAN